ncbi:MAG: hypothetical protein EHM64_16655 [Ignavibacteriae bacterium]|nr:MAG: hypothetical protein EHM64_16655 [Ignavibacteriota bacterium]
MTIYVLTSTALSQEKKYYYYRPLEYGSDAMFNPIGVLMNGGLDVLQSYNSSTRADGILWNVQATSVWRSVTAPGYYISRYGWNKFLNQEVFPTSFNIAKAQWAPNYTLHLIGGGMEYRKLSEWYDYHGYPLPFFFGAATAMGYHFINELIENGPAIHGNTDAIADFCIFDPLGIVFFSFDGVAEYFSSNFQMNDWSPQPSISFHPLSFRNFGHSFVMRYPVTESKRTRAFLYLGKSTLLGLSLNTDDEDAVSLGGGVTQTSVWEVDVTNGIGTNSIHVGAACGIFYDRNNSLLASLLISEFYLERIRLNIYPGVFAKSPFSPGFFFTIGDRGTYSAGITMQYSPFGFGMYAPH